MTTLIDARALWWYEADDCRHDRRRFDCDCRRRAGWFSEEVGWGVVADLTEQLASAAGAVAGGLVGGLVGVGVSGRAVYVTDRRVLIREDQLVNWPTPGQPGRPYMADATTVSDTVAELAGMLTAPEVDAPMTRTFAPRWLTVLTAAGCQLRPLAHDSGVHAVVDSNGVRIGLVMPLRTGVEGSRS